MCRSQPTDDKPSLIGAWSGHVSDQLTIFGAEPKVVKFCTQVGYINSSNRMTYHPQKRRGYGYVTFKILPFSVMQRVAWVRQRQLSYLFLKIILRFYYACCGRSPSCIIEIQGFNGIHTETGWAYCVECS